MRCHRNTIAWYQIDVPEIELVMVVRAGQNMGRKTGRWGDEHRLEQSWVLTSKGNKTPSAYSHQNDSHK